MARFRVVTKHQISGWRFLLRRIEHALVRREVSMIDDPQRGRSTALSIGIALACVVVAGAAVMAFFKPAKQVGNADIVADKNSGALYVKVGGRLYPALNLTSARLISGKAADPVPVSQQELDKYPRGPWVGIPGAPDSMVGSTDRDSSWSVCDTTRTGADAPIDRSTGLPTTAGSAVVTTAIGGPLTVDDDTTHELSGDQARLLRNGSLTWLVYDDRDKGVVRAAIDLRDSAVTLALGIDATMPVPQASRGLIEAIPEMPPLRVPDVPGAGGITTLSSGLSVPVGSVLSVSSPDRPSSYYLASQSGLVQISAVLAAVVRNADSHGTATTMAVGPDVVAANLRPGSWPGTEDYPARAVQLVDPNRYGVTCYHWSRGGRDPNASTQLLYGRRLPLTAEQQSRIVGLVTAPASHGATADTAYLPGGTGRFVQVTGANPASPLRESLYWISDSGVRYGIDVAPDGNGDQTLAALGLRAPLPAPWSVVSLFAVGPALSQRDARIQHDGIPSDKSAVGLPQQSEGGGP
ncbi:type VII secretion protein EccB [Nocardia africana]|uniref:Type VII secretion system protein eccB1 n=1 Tax=Nocardia africana TaxID=134964 RepID=A0A378WNA3_9NOCA|nr:type VII secretion protein EccB [Nocardia africana]MCC3315287.1 type VII secretion protein EccB [Nocardia africana]SUA42412.1 Type VII secretion system protein eccB1 [Nocardia africana]